MTTHRATKSTVVITTVLLLALGLVVTTGRTLGAFTAAVTNAADGAASGVLAVAATPNTATCDTRPTANTTSAASCDGTTLPATTPSTGSSSAVTTITNTGSVTATSARVSAQSCGPVQLVNSVASADPMLVRGSISYAQSTAPVSANASIGLAGTDSMTTNVVSQTMGRSSTVGIWFKVPTTSTGGVLMGLGSSPANLASETFDRVLWMDSSGHLNFSFATNGLAVALSSGFTTYRDNAWHFAAVTVTYNLGTLAVASALYVDGASAGTTFNILTTPSTPSGYWHIGWSPIVGATGFFGSTTNNLIGNVANAFTDNAVSLTQSQIQTLYASASPTQWQTNLAAVGADEAWALGDAGTTIFAGPYPVIGSTSPCTMINAQINSTSTTLAALITTPVTFTPPAPAASTSLTIATSRGGTYNTSYLPGLHLMATMTVTASIVGWSTTLGWASVKQQVIV